MGRTNPTFRDLLRRTETQWKPYRRALRRTEQEHFDQLFEHARAHADAAGYLNPDEPLFPILFSMLIEQQAAIESLRARVATLESDAGLRETGRTLAADQQLLMAPSQDDGSED